VRRWLNLETSEVSFYDEKDSAAADDEDEDDTWLWPTRRPLLRGPISRYLRTTVYIEVLPPDAATDSEVPSLSARASVQWAIATTRRLLAENRIPEDAKKKKSKLAHLLEAEAQKAVRAGQLNRALKATYLENQLIPWGIWPLSSFK
jgi:hypothetical protein